MTDSGNSLVMPSQRAAPERQERILDRTLQFLLSKEQVRSRKVIGVYLTNYFTVIRLDDDSVGACMSSFSMSPSELAQNEQSLQNRLSDDPLLLGYISDCGNTVGVGSAIKAALANGLSAPLLSSGGDPYFTRLQGRPDSFYSNTDYAVVIGMGGLFEFIVRRTTALKIHVSDLKYESKKEKMDAQLNPFRVQYPYLDITISDGSDTAAHLANADFVAITGSTLGNNTLDELLRMSQNCRRIILQGQSASIHPRYLFEAGVHLVLTSIKPTAVAEAAERDRSGRGLLPYLEGSLPDVYLEPITAEYAVRFLDACHGPLPAK